MLSVFSPATQDPALPADPLDGLDSVPWGRLHHAYGAASDIPGRIRGLTDPDDEVRQEAWSTLLSTVYHHGTRWQASRYIVPFVVGLIDDPATPDRAVLVGLLRAVAIGDREDGELPFSPAAAFSAAVGVTPEIERTVLTWLYDEDTRPDEAQLAATDAVAAYWAQGAYEAAARHAPSYLSWLADEDVAVAAGAAELLAWFPATIGAVPALLAVPADDAYALARSSANLALAHLTTAAAREPEVDTRLVELLDAPHLAVQLTAAVALAYRNGPGLPDDALGVLRAASGSKISRREWSDAWPWERPPGAFAEWALARAER
jgi:hypothetical protein